MCNNGQGQGSLYWIVGVVWMEPVTTSQLFYYMQEASILRENGTIGSDSMTEKVYRC